MEDSAHLGLMLCRFALMVQAAVLDCQFLDLFPLFNDGHVPPDAKIIWPFTCR
jgi:hypothetical protein